MKICLIGSVRFIDDYGRVNAELTLKGHAVYSIARVSTRQNSTGITDDERETLDLVHLLKIQQSDVVVLITNRAGYMDESTRREAKWATLIGKSIVLPHNILDISAQLSKMPAWIEKELSELSGIVVPGKGKPQ